MNSFQELNLNPLLKRAIDEMGFEKPSPVQVEALPILLGDEPTDFLGLAATGTGKTAAFGIPLLQKLNPKLKAVQALILCPTRELALQVSGQINLMGKYLGVKSLPIYGGASYGDQLYGLKSGMSVVVGTPGRLVEHLEKGTLKLGSLQTIILDEADEMISMGFKDELEKILSATPRESSNIWFFSATMGAEVRKVADEYLVNPKRVQVNREEMLPDTIEQLYFKTNERDKPEILCKLIDAADDFYGLIFCQTKALVMDLTQYLNGRGYAADCLHGDLEQEGRERAMRGFRSRQCRVLVCTDVASRGLDVKDITHVINYSLPRELDNYVHRIGRTARSGKKGVAMSLVTMSHKGLISRIERMTKSRMHEGKIPTRRELATKKVGALLAKFEDQPFHSRALELLGDDWKQSLAGKSGEEIAARFVTLMFSDIFSDRNSETLESSRGNRGAALVTPISVTAPSAKGSTPTPVVKSSVAPVAAVKEASPASKEKSSMPAQEAIEESPKKAAKAGKKAKKTKTKAPAEEAQLESPVYVEALSEMTAPEVLADSAEISSYYVPMDSAGEPVMTKPSAPAPVSADPDSEAASAGGEHKPMSLPWEILAAESPPKKKKWLKESKVKEPSEPVAVAKAPSVQPLVKPLAEPRAAFAPQGDRPWKRRDDRGGERREDRGFSRPGGKPWQRREGAPAGDRPWKPKPSRPWQSRDSGGGAGLGRAPQDFGGGAGLGRGPQDRAWGGKPRFQRDEKSFGNGGDWQKKKRVFGAVGGADSSGSKSARPWGKGPRSQGAPSPGGDRPLRRDRRNDR